MDSGLTRQETRPPERLAQLLQTWDTIVVREHELAGIFDLRRMEELTKDLTFQTSRIRDDGVHFADVRRGGTQRDLEGPARELVDILADPKSIEFMTRLLGERRYAADCQVHRMREGSSLEKHRHGPDDVFAIFHLSQPYTGGKYFEERNGQISYPVIPPYSLVVSKNQIIHGVDPVLSGARVVVVTNWDPSERKS